MANLKINEIKNLSTALAGVILLPRVTEKAAYAGENRTYTFNVARDANKISIKRAIKAMYGIDPVSVNTIVSKSQNVFVRGRNGKSKLTKKAMITLKKGDSIELA